MNWRENQIHDEQLQAKMADLSESMQVLIKVNCRHCIEIRQYRADYF